MATLLSRCWFLILLYDVAIILPGHCTEGQFVHICFAGLINQLYSHIAAFILASTMGAEVVLPPALMRNSFGSYYSTFKEKNEVTWTPASTNLLLDVISIQKAWQAQGVAVHEVRTLCVVLQDKT